MLIKISNNEKVPVWAIDYLINGTMDNLTDEEINMINDWQESFVEAGHFVDFEVVNGNPYFETCPAFGKATDVVEVDVYRD